MVMHFREPLFLDVLEGGGRGYAKANEEHICLGVGQGTETVVILLTCAAG